MNAKQSEYRMLVQEHLAFINKVLSVTVIMAVIGLTAFCLTSTKIMQKDKSFYQWLSIASFSFSMGGSSLVCIPFWLAKRDQVRKELES
jgi:hypothetical protein